MGDSLTAGYGLSGPEGFVPRLQAWLDEAGADARVVNAGVSGDTTAAGASRIDWTLTEEVDAVIVALGGNDFLRGIDPAVSRANLRTILDAAREAEVEAMLVGIRASGNYGPEYRAEFDAMYPDLAAEYGAIFAQDWFEGLRPADGDIAAALGRTMQDDGIHPNAEGVELIVEDLGPLVLDLIEEARSAG